MFGGPWNGIREGRTATKPLPNLPTAMLIDQLAAVTATTCQTPEELRRLIRTARKKRTPLLWAPQRRGSYGR